MTEVMENKAAIPLPRFGFAKSYKGNYPFSKPLLKWPFEDSPVPAFSILPIKILLILCSCKFKQRLNKPRLNYTATQIQLWHTQLICF